MNTIRRNEGEAIRGAASRCAAFYGRVSTKHQENSLELQLLKARAYALTKNFELTDDWIFSDPESSKIPFPKRDGGQLLINKILLYRKLGHPAPSHIIIAKIDRLGRSVLDLETQVQWFKQNELALHITDLGGDSISTQGAIGQFFLRILFCFAELERDMNNERTQETLAHLRAQNRRTGTIPFGWDLQPGGKTLAPNLAEQSWIVRMDQWRNAGWSYSKIAKELNRQGVRPKKAGQQGGPCGSNGGPCGSHWHESGGSIKGILENKTVRHFLNGTVSSESETDTDIAA